ncbi:type I-C CRISPR-associated protein Cas7/Csd2 [Methylohalobius crimeensis]|uniref:type I-C CRISPR-associated protein Cas7/Csd2 n=1 Tax=Methylohalobius crimeensis TaxID=244365 RepID=UPI0003B317F8|nr:type I-C CRISPR-associated protein Cas7/Csd2 [Methylohalobius crimeensis]
MNPINHRYEFVYLFDVTNGNPNGDPDAGNLPRLDPETNCGLVTDVCLKRKIRNFVQLIGEGGQDIFIQEKRPLNPLIAEACEAKEQPSFKKKNGSWDKDKAKSRSAKDIGDLQRWLCNKYYDVRTFGAVMSTGPNAGQIRGPIQFGFANSIDPIVPLEVSITRVTDVDKEEGEMGRKHIVPYGLYRAHGFVSAKLAERTGFSEDDLELLWNALINMFEHDRSAARGEMAARKLLIFKHENAMGNAPAHILFDSVKVERSSGEPDTPARNFGDYQVIIDRAAIPSGVELIERL